LRNLVAGGAGFIGSHLCKTLLEMGEDVICLDNLSSGQTQNVTALQSFNSFSFKEADVIDPVYFEVDRIYNLACPASPPFYQADPIQTMKTNVLGSLNLLNLAEANQATILQASTSEVYGDPLQHPQKETYWGNVNPIGIRSCYDEGKRAAESLFFDYMRKGLEIKVVRIFNTYGPSMRPDDGRVVSNMIMQAITGQPLTIYGSGSHTRSFCYIDDMVRGLITVMNSPGGITGPFNLGNPGEFTIMELAELIRNKVDKNLKIDFLPPPLDDPTQRKPDISLVKETTGWEPSIPLAIGLEMTIKYFKELVKQ
jgi:UDP-glucuronate decarboxylase